MLSCAVRVEGKGHFAAKYRILTAVGGGVTDAAS